MVTEFIIEVVIMFTIKEAATIVIKEFIKFKVEVARAIKVVEIPRN